jgi:hypothetical protein
MAILTIVYAVVKDKNNLTYVLETGGDFNEYWAEVTEGLTNEECKAYKVVGGYLSDVLCIEDFSQITE